MKNSTKQKIPYQQIENGALMLEILRENKTWEELCERYEYAFPNDPVSTTTMMLLKKLFEMQELGLITFQVGEGEVGKRPISEIKETGLWSKIRVAFGGMSLSDASMLSRHASGMAVVPVFDRPKKLEEKIDIFVLMPFNQKMEKVYFNHIKKLGDEMGKVIRRADDILLPGAQIMEKVWDGICSAELVLADCTERNPNVFYEIGIAHTLGKKVILITRSKEDIPADIGHYEYIQYVYDPEGTDQLIEKLRGFIKSHFAPAEASLK